MGLKKYKPTTSARRDMSVLDFNANLTKTKPTKPLLRKIKTQAGRNKQGKIVVRHRGGGSKRKYRLIDFKRNKDNVIGKISSIEYDPNRSANISLVKYLDGEKRYILTPKTVPTKAIIGQEIISGEKVEIKIGNSMPLKNIPEGTFIHNLEITPGHGGQLARSAGSSIQIVAIKENEKYVTIKFKSGEVRKILAECRATIGEVGNEEHNLVNQGKAGRNRYRGFRPTVRGSAMNAVDHPHGGGEGKQPIGRKTPYTPWGKKALGVRTRNKKKASSKLIMKRRKGRK